MMIFAFPGTGKTTLSEQEPQAIELEISEIKYDNSTVSHLSKEARKAVKRPLKTKNYRQVYVGEAMRLYGEEKVVLVALNYIVPILWEMRKNREKDFHIYLPQHSLRQEYRQRYLTRGNNDRFIREVMWVWTPTILLFKGLQKVFPSRITFLGEGEFLKNKLEGRSDRISLEVDDLQSSSICKVLSKV